MTVKIVTDSLGDIPSEVAEELGITVIPINVIFGTINYRDGVDLTTDQFYEKLEVGKVFPTTIVPPLGRFADNYDKVAEETDQIIVITSSYKLSASYETAVLARERMKRQCRVEVIDSLSAVMAQGLIVIATARAAKKGAGIEELMALTRKNIPRADVRMALETLEYLRRGGRIGKAQAFLGTMLKVIPILGIKDGEVFPFSREHSRARAIEHLYEFAAGFSRVEGIGVEHATTPDEAEMLVKRLKAKFPKTRIYLSRVSPVIGAHVGPRVLGVAVLGDRG
jgi:DegV family protein with EDD domain